MVSFTHLFRFAALLMTFKIRNKCGCVDGFQVKLFLCVLFNIKDFLILLMSHIVHLSVLQMKEQTAGMTTVKTTLFSE